MNVEQEYYDFLFKHNAIEKVQSVIDKGIREWKEKPAYEFIAGEFSYHDYSGEVRQLYGKTIGDICKTDMDVLLAYSGEREPTFESRCGWNFTSVADMISDDINDCLIDLEFQFFKENMQRLIEHYKIVVEDDWDEHLILDTILDESGCIMNMEWMNNNFKQYYHKFDYIPCDAFLVFKISG